MNTLIVEQAFNKTGNSRKKLIDALRAALNAAEGGENEVNVTYNNTEIMWNFSDGEFLLLVKCGLLDSVFIE